MCVAAVLAGSGACAARRPPFNPADLTLARGLVQQGCYECLLEARSLYERVAEARGPAVARQRLFEVNLLLALREKELALDPAEAMRRARALVRELPPQADAERLVALVDVVPPDERGVPKALRGPVLEALMRPEFRTRSLGWVTQAAVDPMLKEYLLLAVECARPTLGDQTLPAPVGTAGLLTFRRAICKTIPDRASLEQLLTDVPRFVEAGLFLARATLFDRDTAAVFSLGRGRVTATAYLAAPRQRFPASTAVTYEMGIVAQVDGDLRRAAEHYTETLALQPAHEDARLGRATAFTYLGRSEDAVADATYLIEAGAYNRGEAFYWRAYNRHRDAQERRRGVPVDPEERRRGVPGDPEERRQGVPGDPEERRQGVPVDPEERRQGVPVDSVLERARADIEQAKTLAASSRVLTLAGMIEHDQGEYEIATADLTLAAKLDRSNCVARWYLGVVTHTLEAWRETGGAFAEAARCYDAAAQLSERARDEMAARTDLDEEFRTRQIAGFDTAIKEDRSQESASALNAAIGYARAGDRQAAERFIDQAARDPARRMTAEDLRQVMRGPQ